MKINYEIKKKVFNHIVDYLNGCTIADFCLDKIIIDEHDMKELYNRFEKNYFNHIFKNEIDLVVKLINFLCYINNVPINNNSISELYESCLALIEKETSRLQNIDAFEEEKVNSEAFDMKKDNFEEKLTTISIHVNKLLSDLEDKHGEIKPINEKDYFIRLITFIYFSTSLDIDISLIEEMYLSFLRNNHNYSSKLISLLEDVVNSQKKESTDNFNEKDGFETMIKEITDSIVSGSNHDFENGQEDNAEYMRKFLEVSKKTSIENGTYDLPGNMGNIIIGLDKTDKQSIKQFAVAFKESHLLYLKKEGVTDFDIMVWWNQPDVSRHYTYRSLYIDYMRYCLMSHKIECSIMDEESKFEALRRNVPDLFLQYKKNYHIAFPVYKAFEYKPNWVIDKWETENDRPLPIELIDRVNRYLKKVDITDVYRLANEGKHTINKCIHSEKDKRRSDLINADCFKVG